MSRFIVASTVSLVALAAAPAFASSDLCHTPKSEWQPKEILQKKLEADGWQVRRIKEEDGCYETYAIDAKGKMVEVYFDPKSFEPVKEKDHD